MYDDLIRLGIDGKLKPPKCTKHLLQDYKRALSQSMTAFVGSKQLFVFDWLLWILWYAGISIYGALRGKSLSTRDYSIVGLRLKEVGMDLLGSILNSMEAPPDDKEGKKARMSEYWYDLVH